MNPANFISEVLKYISLTDTSKEDIRIVTGWSPSTMQRRFKHPETITLGEADLIAKYLGMKL